MNPRTNKRGVDVISGALSFGRLWYDGPNAVANAMATLSIAAAHMMP